MIVGDSGVAAAADLSSDAACVEAGRPLRHADLIAVTDRLREAAGELDAALEARATELLERLGTGAFRLAFCGGFSNGKSTLINALLAAPVLPVGVLPVTAVPTEIVAGPRFAATVELIGGTSIRCEVGQLAQWASEAENPLNRKGVRRAVVEARSALLDPGVMLVDTPGLESIFARNDEAAQETIRDADGTVVVLSADSPLTAAERRLLDVVAERSSMTFFVLNRIDHLSETEAAEAEAFIAREVREATGVATPVYALSARDAFDAAVSGRSSRSPDLGMKMFRRALDEFVSQHLVEVRLGAFGRAVSRLADAIEDREALERAALQVTASELATRIRRFNAAVVEQRHALDNDRVLLAEAAKTIDKDLAQWMRTAGQQIPDGSLERFSVLAAEVPLRHLEGRLDAEIQAIVEERFDGLRPEAAERVNAAWAQAADQFTAKVQGRVDAIRSTAAAQFGASLRPIPVPEVRDEPDRFWYYFHRPELPDARVYRALRLALPHGLVRRRLMASASEHLAHELDKHAGRARSDLSRRLDGTHRRFASELVSFVDDVINEIHQATARADVQRRELGDLDREVAGRQQRIGAAIAEARHLAAISSNQAHRPGQEEHL